LKPVGHFCAREKPKLILFKGETKKEIMATSGAFA